MNDSHIAVFADVSIVARYRGPTTPNIIEEQCYDISKGGMFVRSFNPLPNGTLIKFECRVDDNPNDIQGIGRVVWQRDEDCPEAPSGMGVKFLVLRPGSPEIIESVIRKAGAMPKLFEFQRKDDQAGDRERAHQRTSNRARTLVGNRNRAGTLAVEVEQNLSATREQSLLTAKNAQKLVSEAKKDETEKSKIQSDSVVSSAPVIAVAQAHEPRNEPTTADAIAQNEGLLSQTAAVKASAQGAAQQQPNAEFQTDTKTIAESTARALRLAALRAKELAREEATQLNLEVSAENAMRSERRSTIFSAKGLVFTSVTAVILLRLGYVMLGGPEDEQQSERASSAAATAPMAAQVGSSDPSSSQEAATQASGSDRPAVEPPGQDALRQAAQTAPVTSDKAIEPRKSQSSQTSATEANREQSESRFEKAAACQKRGDSDCVIRLLSYKASSDRERRLLADAYRSKERAQKKTEERESRPTERRAKRRVSRKTASGIPDNPF